MREERPPYVRSGRTEVLTVRWPCVHFGSRDMRTVQAPPRESLVTCGVAVWGKADLHAARTMYHLPPDDPLK